MSRPVPEPEFSRAVALPRFGSTETVKISATAVEREALARRFGLLGIDRLEATAAVTALRKGARLDATLEAEVVQECVVTLDAVRNTVSESVTILYGEAPDGADEDAVVEPLDGDAVDVGEAVAQQLSLALDPYPRAPGAALDPRFVEAEAARPVAPLGRRKKT